MSKAVADFVLLPRFGEWMSKISCTCCKCIMRSIAKFSSGMYASEKNTHVSSRREKKNLKLERTLLAIINREK